MSQININDREPRASGDRTAAAGINMVTVLITLVVLAVLVWFLFTGPLAGVFGSGNQSDTNININPPALEQPNNSGAPAGEQGGNEGGQEQAPAPSQ